MKLFNTANFVTLTPSIYAHNANTEKFKWHFVNKYECTADQELADAAAYAPGRRPPCCSTFLFEMTSWPPSWNCDVLSEIRLRQSMRIYLKNNPAKFHADEIWNDGALALGFLKRFPNKKNYKINNNKMSSNMMKKYDLKNQVIQ